VALTLRTSNQRLPGKSVYDYFHQAMRNSGNTPTDARSAVLFGEEDNCAAFEVRHCEGKISDVRFKCTTCFTLVAFCEHIAELARGMGVAEAQEIGPDLLLELHPEVPAHLANRADLASAAFRAALRNTIRESR
jgi:NifU-like protein involved in Fe-S cluster formation